MKYFLILLLLGGCSSLTKKPEISETSRDLPPWVYSPYDECIEAEFLCATGEARETNNADAQAKANLASIFEVKIQSDLNVSTSSNQTFPWQSDVRQEVQQSLKESVNQVLETVQIKKRFRKDKLSYSLVSLDRQKAAELIGGRMIKIDHELETLWAARQRTNLRRIVKLQTEREKLNERYSIVAGAPRPEVVTFAEIVKWRESRPKTEALALRIGQAPDWMTEKIKELLTESGFRLVKGDAKKILTVQVDSIKEFLNVDGFEKYTFTLNMTSIENAEKKKVITASETVTGRSQGDALLKVKSFFNDYIEYHLSDLHLD